MGRDMHLQTISESASSSRWPGARGTSGQRRVTTGCLSRWCSTATALALHGVICPSGSVTFARCTRGPRAGARRACGDACSSTWPAMRTTSTLLNRLDHRASPPAQRGGRKKRACCQAIGRSRGGLSTKIHATVDALGNPTGFHLAPGQAHDLEGADALLPARRS